MVPSACKLFAGIDDPRVVGRSTHSLAGHCQVGSPGRAMAAFRPWRMLPTRTAASATRPR